MKIRVENINLKGLLTEATYQDAFSKIQTGDIITFKMKEGGSRNSRKAEVVSKYGNEVILKPTDTNNEYFMLGPNSFKNGKLEFIYMSMVDGKLVKSNKVTTIDNVYNIIVSRDGKTVTGVTPDTGRSTDNVKKQKKKQEEFNARKEDISNEINNLDEDDVFELTTGKLITKGSDKGSLAKNTITTLELKVIGKTEKGVIKSQLKSVDGPDASKYESLKNKPLFFGPTSVKVTNNAIVLTVRYKKNGSTQKFSIDNIYGMENLGLEEPSVDNGSGDIEISKDEIMNIINKSPALSQYYFGQNGLFRKKKAYGDIYKILNTKLSPLGSYKVGDKVKFEYLGKNKQVTDKISLTKGDELVGKLLDNNKLQIKSRNAKDALIFDVYNKISKDNINVANVTHEYINNNKLNKKDLGRVKIKILK